VLRLVAGLLLVQTALLGLLSWQVLIVERAVTASAMAPARSVQPALPPMPMAAGPRQHGNSSIDEENLRRIIREELESSRSQDSEPRHIAEAAMVSDPQMDLEYQRRSLVVDERLNYFGQVGQITPVEMSQLQAEIARLRPGDREEMLKRLVRAINSGAIDGRL
jgi:hypothetical protein